MALKKKTKNNLKELIESLKECGNRAVFDGDVLKNPKGLTHEQLSMLKLPNGKPVSGELEEWLGYAANWFDLIKTEKNIIALNTITLTEYLNDYFSEDNDEYSNYVDDRKFENIAKEISATPSTHVISLSETMNQKYFLLLENDANELQVIALEKEELWIAFDNLGDFFKSFIIPDPKPIKTDGSKNIPGQKKQKIQKTGPRRQRLKKMELKEIKKLSDEDLITYGFQLAELGNKISSDHPINEVIAILEKRELWQGLYKMLRTNIECTNYIQNSRLTAKVGVLFEDMPMCEIVIDDFIRSRKRNLIDEYKMDITEIGKAAEFIGREEDVLNVMEYALKFNYPGSCPKIASIPFLKPLWERKSMIQFYPEECKRQIEAIDNVK